MSDEKNLKVRIIHKHDTEANWLKATGFIPKLAELIVYEPDETYNYSRYKIGDGITAVNDLPFSNVQPDLSQDDRNAADYVKGKTNYYTPYNGLGYRSFEVHPAELDFGVYLVGTADNASHFARIFDYETIISEKYGVMHCTMDIDWSSLGRGVIHQEPNPDNFLLHVQLIDDKNYKYDLNTVYGLTVYFIVDVETLADEYKDMFPTYGVYLHYYEGSYSFPIRNLNVVLMRYQRLDVRFMDSRVPTARTAKIGQTIVVKSVNSEGRPIEWETADLLQSDWEQTDDTQLDFIKNKPDTITPDMILQMLDETGAAQPIADADNSVITTDDNKILIL